MTVKAAGSIPEIKSCSSKPLTDDREGCAATTVNSGAKSRVKEMARIT
jgi:hypothetical protein